MKTTNNTITKNLALIAKDKAELNRLNKEINSTVAEVIPQLIAYVQELKKNNKDFNGTTTNRVILKYIKSELKAEKTVSNVLSISLKLLESGLKIDYKLPLSTIQYVLTKVNDKDNKTFTKRKVNTWNTKQLLAAVKAERKKDAIAKAKKLIRS